jgi:hypothetical protein
VVVELVDGGLLWVTVTVTVVVEVVLVLVFRVRVVVVPEPCELAGGRTVTVLEVLEDEQTPGRGSTRQGACGGPGTPPPEVSDELSVDPEPASPADEVSPVDAEEQESVRTAGLQSSRPRSPPTPGVVVESAARTAAVSLAGAAAAGAPSPPVTSTPTGTAATTARGTQRRARTGIRDDPPRRCTRLLPGSRVGPRPARRRAACVCSHPGSALCQRRRRLWQGDRVREIGTARTRNPQPWWRFWLWDRIPAGPG